jgi:2-oxoisovalerate dehydrogenase E1 component alpha subunit
MSIDIQKQTKTGAVGGWERIYRAMFRGRRFDELALKLQRQGAIDSFGEGRGQEAAQIGAVIDLGPDDMVFPSYRQPSVGLEQGVSPVELLRFYAGVDNCPWDWRKHRFGPYCIPVGSQVAHATGWAWGSRLRGEGAATVVFFGDGAASQGEVHEAMNYGGVFAAPIVYLLENNGWAISMPSGAQSQAGELAARGAAYGMVGVRVDGNDVFAVREVVAAALDRAREGAGPTLVEAVTYRMGGHTTSDDPDRYRPDGALEEWGARDPLDAFRATLDGVEPSELEQIETAVEAELQASVDDFLRERGMS